MKTRKAIVITLDGWSANFLGPYGNTWVETSTLNDLARDALLIEHAYADGTELASVLSSIWQGRHMLCPTEDAVSLGRLMTTQNRTVHLVTDDESVAHHPLAAEMSSVTYVKVSSGTQSASDAMQTDFGQFLASAAESLADDESDCFWIHAKAFTGAWDAPFELRMALTDAEEDPDPTRSVEPPSNGAISDEDPDAAWNLARSYAAQVMSVDRCLEVLFEIIDEHPSWRDALLIVTSPRSFPLGEHGKVGLVASPNGSADSDLAFLHGEALHVPLFIRSPEESSLLLRSQAIVQPASIYSTLVEWLGLAAPKNVLNQDCSASTGARSLLGLFADDRDDTDGPSLEQQLVCAVSRRGKEMSLRTPGWFFRKDGSVDAHGNERVALYVKPDDRWEANEVADRCSDVVEAMQSFLIAFVEAAGKKRLDQLEELPEILLTSTI